MNRKLLIGFLIVGLLLIGSLIGIGSGNTNYTDKTSEAIDETCSGDCNNCDAQCEGPENCDESGTCSQNKEITKNCNSDGSCSGTCSQNTKRIRNCNSGSGCSGSCKR